MGTDVSYVVEMKTPDQGWVGIMGTGTPGSPDWTQSRSLPLWRFTGRDYQFFNALCGVRGDNPKIDAIPGIPDDASSLTKFLVSDWGETGHSHHHCSFREFVLAKMYANEAIGEATASKLKGTDPVIEFLGMRRYDSNNLDRLRVCFWFDC